MDDFPLQRIDKKVLEKRFELLAKATSQLVNKEISIIQSDIQRILNVVQENGVEGNSKR